MRFEQYHPLINLLYFSGIFYFAIAFSNPLYIAVTVTLSFIYSIQLIGKKAAAFNLLCIGVPLIFSLFYASFNHFGITNLFINFAGNQITLESLLYGLSLGFRAYAVIIWATVINKIFTTDKVGYLFGRISPRLSLYFSISIRMASQIKKRFSVVITARSAVGKGNRQGLPFRRMANGISIISIVITATLDELMVKGKSMNNRGYCLKHKTVFSSYRFDNRDRSLVVIIFLLLTIIFMATAFEQTMMLFNPQIIFSSPTVSAFFFLSCYFCYAALPLVFHLKSEFVIMRNNLKSMIYNA